MQPCYSGLKDEVEDNLKKSLKKSNLNGVPQPVIRKLNLFSPSLQDSVYFKSCQMIGNEENACSNIEMFEREDMNASENYKKELDADGNIFKFKFMWLLQSLVKKKKNLSCFRFLLLL